jgi:phospho-N-acetylmuramoyl-pentapeptide-transferase
MLRIKEVSWLGDTFFAAFIVGAFIAYPLYRLLISLNSRQTVSQYAPEGHQKKQGTPTMGGLIIVIGGAFALTATVMGPIGTRLGGRPWLLFAALALLAGFALIGFADDFIVPRLTGKRGLGWKQKIILQILIAAGVAAYVTGGYRDSFVLGWQFWLVLFSILFFSNAYNFSDGLDGLAGSLLLTLGLGIAALAVHSGAPLEIIAVVAALMGAVLPFLVMNAPPARVFMGDVGSLPIGACLGLAFAFIVVDGPKGVVISRTGLGDISTSPDWPIQLILPLSILSLIMAAELLPVPLQILSVKLRKKKLFAMTPIHHAFEAKGWPESRIVWIFALAQLVLSGAALYTHVKLVDNAERVVVERAMYGWRR